MRSFTAKEFSRCPAKVYEAAREDGSVEITHDRFSGRFYFSFLSDELIEDSFEEIILGIEDKICEASNNAHKKAPFKGL